MDRSEAREVMADHTQTAFGTPVFSQRPDTGYLAPAPSDSLPHCMCPHRVPHLHDRQSIGYRGCSSVTLHVTAVVRQEQGRLHELFQLVCDQNERLTVTDADVPTMSG